MDHPHQKRNVALLSSSQALFTTSQSVLIITAGLIGQIIADDKALSTLPVSLAIVATAMTTIPASLYMQRVGRRAGFLTGAFIGLMGTALATYSVWIGNFWLFAAATFVMGINGGFAQFFRFAAADTASLAFRPRAISLVVAGGIVAAFIGPMIVRNTNDLFAVPFLGPFVVLLGVAVVSMAFLSFLDIPKLTVAESHEPARPLIEIVKQPVFIVAVLGGMVGYGAMTLVMTSAPIAMVGCGFGVPDAADAIQWHIVAMFAPSLVTGSIIQRFGVLQVMATGMVLLTGCVAVALTGLEIAHFTTALIALGLGWNFSFVGASTLLTEAYKPSERAKVQAINDFLVFGMAALGSLSSGMVMHWAGWNIVQLLALPFIAVSGVATVWLLINRRKAVASA